MQQPIVTLPSFSTDAAAALLGFRERGYHVEPGLVPDDVTLRVRQTAEALPNFTDGTCRPIPMPHLVDPVFLAMMAYRPIVTIVEQLVGGKASGLGGEYFFMPPGTPGFSAHQDNTYVQAPPDQFVSVWTALCDVEADNGSLVFYPGSHVLGDLPVERRDVTPHPSQNPGAQAVTTVMPAALPTIDVVARRGTTVFFHSQLIHASNSNISTDRFRHSFLATYIRQGAPFEPGQAQKRREVRLSDEGAALLE